MNTSCSTEKTALQYRLEQYYSEGIAAYYAEVLAMFKEGEWVMPTNRNDECFSVFKQLHELHLVAKQTVPVWNEGHCKGVAIYFKYKHNLKY